jgi:hypothetical protein
MWALGSFYFGLSGVNGVIRTWHRLLVVFDDYFDSYVLDETMLNYFGQVKDRLP